MTNAIDFIYSSYRFESLNGDNPIMSCLLGTHYFKQIELQTFCFSAFLHIWAFPVVCNISYCPYKGAGGYTYFSVEFTERPRERGPFVDGVLDCQIATSTPSLLGIHTEIETWIPDSLQSVFLARTEAGSISLYWLAAFIF